MSLIAIPDVDYLTAKGAKNAQRGQSYSIERIDFTGNLS